MIFDSTLSFKLHVSSVARTCYYQIRQIRTVRKSLTQESYHTLIRTLVFSRLDYCNSLLAGAPKVLLDQLSCVMRASARLTLGLSRFSHVAVITREKLHWLDFPARVVFKLCVTAFRCLHGLAPGYLAGSCVYLSPLFLVAVICALLPWVPWSSHLVGLLRLVSAHLLLHVRVLGTCFHLIYGQLISAFKPSVRSSRLSFLILILNSSWTFRLSDPCLFLC